MTTRSDAPGPTWAVGVLTAPRPLPRLGPTLQSLARAGFDSIRIFAEPGSPIPPEARTHLVYQSVNRQGNLHNFLRALTELLAAEPHADFLAIFQDDVLAAVGLRQWLDQQPWPLDAGVVSLFTPRLHSADRIGWHRRMPGFFQVHGAQALAFRRQAAQRFLDDPIVAIARRYGPLHDDAVVSGWATRRGLGIAYHTPSLVQHVGHLSSLYPQGPDRRTIADAVSNVSQIPTWRIPPRRRGRVGLVGWSVPTGIGYQNLDLALGLPCDRWLIPDHPELPLLDNPTGNCRRIALPDYPDPNLLDRSLDGLDWILFVERPFLHGIVQAARNRQIGVACVPNWEWLSTRFDWLPLVDLMLCPTRHTLACVSDWKRRYGYGWEVVGGSWPIHPQHFPFRLRESCQRLLYVDGWGGGTSHSLDGRPLPYQRKGIELIAAAARLDPTLPFLVVSQRNVRPLLPDHVPVLPPPTDNRHLYLSGDLCVQPSHWEGLGLPLLECQAAGLPLVTTGAPPMNEFQPLATIPPRGYDVVVLRDGQIIPSIRMQAADLVDLLQPWIGQDLQQASRAARSYIETDHSWELAGDWIRDALVAL